MHANVEMSHKKVQLLELDKNCVKKPILKQPRVDFP